MPAPRLNAAFYADSVAAFLRDSDDEVYAPLASPHGYTIAPEQLSSWRLQRPVLRAALATLAVFLSGNGPLVAVLREALARDDIDRVKLSDPRARIGTSRTAVRAFIQNVHHFRDATLGDPAVPADHVVVFHKVQRAWDARQLASFMKRKKGLPGFTQTKPELLIGAMKRHADWAVVVCLVCGGQQIKTGEAGISAWLDGARTLFPGWDCFISPHLTNSEYPASGAQADFRTAGRCRAGHLGTVVTPGYLDEFLPRGTPLALREGPSRRLGGARPRALRGVSRPLFPSDDAERAGGAAAHGAGRPRSLLFGPAAQAPCDRHPGEHRYGALVFEPAARHPLIAVSGGRGDGVSGAGAGTRLDDRHVGHRPPLKWERLKLSQFSRGEVDRLEEARAAAVSEERLPRVAHAGPPGMVIFVPPGAKLDRTQSPSL